MIQLIQVKRNMIVCAVAKWLTGVIIGPSYLQRRQRRALFFLSFPTFFLADADTPFRCHGRGYGREAAYVCILFLFSDGNCLRFARLLVGTPHYMYFFYQGTRT
jgi:hypothetical protein